MKFNGVFVLSLVIFAYFTSAVDSAQSNETSYQEARSSLLDPNHFSLAKAGLTKTDFKQIRETLLKMGNKIHSYPESNQVYYWHHLAYSGYRLRLNSDFVLPFLGKALVNSKSLNLEQQVKLLKQSVHIAMEYQQYEEVISYLDQTIQTRNRKPALDHV